MFHREYVLPQHREELSIKRNQKESTASLIIEISPQHTPKLKRKGCSLRQRPQGTGTTPGRFSHHAHKFHRRGSDGQKFHRRGIQDTTHSPAQCHEPSLMGGEQKALPATEQQAPALQDLNKSFLCLPNF